LDPDGDRVVSHQEFQAFLGYLHLDVPPWQAATVYESFTSLVGQDPLNLDNVILCLAIVSRDLPMPNEWTSVAESIGKEISRMGRSYAGYFRMWDTQRQGFLTMADLEAGLNSMFQGSDICRHVPSFMQYLHRVGGTDVDDEDVMTTQKVTMFEFVRACAPRDMAIRLQRSMTREHLKRVWFFRPRLQDMLVKADPRHTNRVSVDAFAECLREVNGQLQPPLTDIQVGAICEIASQGRRWVDYHQFISGLHVVDIEAS